MFSFPFLGLVGLLELSLGASGANADTITCNTQADCPKCSKCTDTNYWWLIHMGNGKWGTCVYDKSNNGTCSRDRCNMGVCTAVNKCEMQPRPDQTNIKCGQTKWCRNGFCAELDDINVSGELNMRGLQGQQVDWKGEDGGWYVLISDTADVQITVRLTAPLSQDFPDRQLITAFGLKYHGGHSVIIETKYPHTSQTEGCLDAWYVPCLAENSLRITVDGEVYEGIPVERASLPGDALLTATNLPAQCQPKGDGDIWTNKSPQITTGHTEIGAKQPQQQQQLVEAGVGARRSRESFSAWASGWSASTVAPTWCAEFLEGAGAEGTLKYKGKHAVLRIETPALTVRLHHGTSWQEGGAIEDDSGFLPGLEFWKMDVHLESYSLNPTVTGILGETMHPVLDGSGRAIMFGPGALRGEVDDYRVSGPLSTDFEFFKE